MDRRGVGAWQSVLARRDGEVETGTSTKRLSEAVAERETVGAKTEHGRVGHAWHVWEYPYLLAPGDWFRGPIRPDIISQVRRPAASLRMSGVSLVSVNAILPHIFVHSSPFYWPA